MERHNWTLGKYDGSEFILGWVYLFVPDWIIVTSDFNLLWCLTSRPALQIFQMENVVWKQNKCFLGCVFLVLRTYQIWGKKIRRETELCLLKRWVCGLVNFPQATWWDEESPEVSCLSHPSPVPCPTTMVVASGSFSRLIYSLSVGLRKERMHNGSHWVQQSHLQVTFQMAKEFPIKWYFQFITTWSHFSLGAEDLKLDGHYCFCLWGSIFMEHSSDRGMGRAGRSGKLFCLSHTIHLSFLPVSPYTYRGDGPSFYPFDYKEQ